MRQKLKKPKHRPRKRILSRFFCRHL